MAITRTAMVDDDGSGTTGTVINNAWKQEFYNQIDAALPVSPVWTSIPFNAANFTALPSGTWTVGAGGYGSASYALVGKVLFFQLYVYSTSVAGAPTELCVALPPGLLCGNLTDQPVSAVDNNTDVTAHGVTLGGENKIRIRRNFGASTPWAAASSSTNMAFVMVIPLQ